METSTPAPPPAPPATIPVERHTPVVPGQLTTAWRLTTVATWVLVFVAWSGVWKASRELGVATWWLGPDSSPRPIVVMLVPFYPPIVMIVLALNNARRIPYYGLVAGAIGAVIGFVDLSYIRRLGVVELAIAAAAAAVSIASTSGMYRAAGVDDVAAPASDRGTDDPIGEVAG